jgi:hypothetical protein
MEMKESTKDHVQPFFARFLEGQEFPNVSTDLKAGQGGPPGGGQHYTMKWPSDDDEGGDEW